MSDKKYIKNTIILFASMAITKIVGALFKIPLMNLLGGTGMGYFSTAYGLYSPVFALTAAAVPTVLTRLTAQCLAAGNGACAVRIKNIAFKLYSCVGLFGTLVVALLAKPFAEHIAGSPKSTLAILCIAPAVMLCCVASVVRGYYEGMSNVMPSAAAATAEACSRAVFGLAMSYTVLALANKAFSEGREFLGQSFCSAEESYNAALPYAAAGAVLAVSISELFGLITLLAADRKNKRIFYPSRDERSGLDICTMLIRETVPIAAFALVMNCVSFVDLLTVTKTLSASATDNTDYYMRAFSSVLKEAGGIEGLPNFMYGSYTGISMSIFMLIPSFAAMPEKASLPEITYAWAKNDNEKLNKSIFTLFRTSAIIAAPACMGAAALAEPIMRLLYKSRAAEVSVCLNSFYVLCLGGLFMTVSSAMFGVFQAIEKAHIPLFIMVGAVIVKLILNPVLISIPSVNIAGAAMASVLGYFLMTLAGGFVLAGYIPQLKAGIIKAVLPPALCGILCGLTAKIVYHFLSKQTNDLITVGFSVISGAIVYLLLLIITGGFRISDTISSKRQKKNEKPLAKNVKIG